MLDLDDALKSSDSPFKACKEFLSYFEKYGKQYGVPPILMASLAMQESYCTPGTVGEGGEQGLMQLSPDKCDKAPNGNCKDIDYNIRTGIEYFSQTLNASGGNVFLAAGGYNGWYAGITYSEATAASRTSCCRCQNNVDYLQQLFNGWIQNMDPYDSDLRIGKYFNLDICS